MPASNETLQYIQQMARTAGLRLREPDLEALALWSTERWRKLALPGMEQYAQLLAQDSAVGRQERELLTVRCTTGESYFFRDPEQIDLLATKLLPELIARRADQRTLRIWSAGCASGEEAYSLAMLVDELAPRLAGWQVLILGTDINREALQKARRGLYREWSFRALSPSRRQHYFQPHGDQWQISQRLRDMVRRASTTISCRVAPSQHQPQHNRGADVAPHAFANAKPSSWNTRSQASTTCESSLVPASCLICASAASSPSPAR